MGRGVPGSTSLGRTHSFSTSVKNRQWIPQGCKNSTRSFPRHTTEDNFGTRLARGMVLCLGKKYLGTLYTAWCGIRVHIWETSSMARSVTIIIIIEVESKKVSWETPVVMSQCWPKQRPQILQVRHIVAQRLKESERMLTSLVLALDCLPSKLLTLILLWSTLLFKAHSCLTLLWPHGLQQPCPSTSP